MSKNSFTALKCLIVFLIPTLGWAATISTALPANTSGSVLSNIVTDESLQTCLTAVNRLSSGALTLRPLSVWAPIQADNISNLSDAGTSGIIPSAAPDPAGSISYSSEPNRTAIFSTTFDPASPVWFSQENSTLIDEIAPVPEPASWTIASLTAAFLVGIYLRSSRIGNVTTACDRGSR